MSLIYYGSICIIDDGASRRRTRNTRFNLFLKFRPSGDNLPFPSRMNSWSDSVLFKLVKNWQFSGNLSLKMNVLSIKR